MIDLLVSRLKVCRAALIVVAMALMPLACSCGRSEQKFRDAIQRGELSEAEQHLGNMSSGDQGEYALQLIRTYLDLDEPAKAIHVYEDITPWHSARGDLKLRPDGYSARASRLLREYLIAHDEYDKAWQYYPLEYDDENYIGNARSLSSYMSDVVLALTARGEIDEAYRFVQRRLQWFVIYVDTSSSVAYSDIRQGFNSQMVRERLSRLIEETY